MLVSQLAGIATVWQRESHVLWRETPKSVLVLTHRANEPLRLEGAVMFVWMALECPATDAELIAWVAACVALPTALVECDVVAAREALCTCGAIVESRG